MTRSSALLTGVLVAAVVFASTVRAGQIDRAEAQRRMNIVREDLTLHETALRLGGRYEWAMEGPDLRYPPLDQLIARAEVVVAAVPESGVPALSADERGIYTYFTLSVATRFKGNPPDHIVVKMLGGEIRFDDGASASMVQAGGLLDVGKPYVLILSAAREGGDMTTPEDVASGVYPGYLLFDVSDRDHGVRQLMTASSRPVDAPYNGWDNDEFLRQVAVIAAGGPLEPPRLVRRVPDPPPPRAASVPRPQPPIPTAKLDRSPMLGDVTSSKVVVEFCDFTSPGCARFATELLPGVVRDLTETGEIRYVFKAVVFQNGPPEGFRVAEAAWCAHAQGRFWPMRQELAAQPGPLTDAALVRSAEAAGVNLEAFATCLATESVAAVRAETDEARRLGVKAVPTLGFGELQADGTFRVTRRMLGAERGSSVVGIIRQFAQ